MDVRIGPFKESWALKNWCFWTREDSRVPWTAERSNQWILKGINSEYSLEGLVPEAEASVLWPSDAKSWLIRKDPDAGKDWRWEKGTTEDEMVGWHHQLNGPEFEQFWEIVKDREAWHAVVHGVSALATEQQDSEALTSPRARSKVWAE